MILTADCLDRCKNDDDWLRKEVAHAIKCDKNIVPVLDEGVKMPESQSLPPDMVTLPQYNATTVVHKLFDASLKEITGFLESNPREPVQDLPPSTRKTGKRKVLFFGLLLVSTIVIAGFLMLRQRNKQDSFSADGWVRPFAGDSHNGWTTRNPRFWEITNGVLVAHTASGLLSPQDYTNFHLIVDAMTTEHGTGSVTLRADPGTRKGYRVVLANDTRYFPRQKSGTITDLSEVSKSPVGDNLWLRMEIVAVGNHLLVKVNDKITTNVVDTNNTYKAGRILFGRFRMGGRIFFRDARIRSLPDEEEAAWQIVEKQTPGIRVMEPERIGLRLRGAAARDDE